MKALGLTQFLTTIATNDQTLSRCMNVNYEAHHKEARSLSFQCIVSIL
jgi:hypothetical protein